MNDIKLYGPLNEKCVFRPCFLPKSQPLSFTCFGSVYQRKSADQPSLYIVHITTDSPSVPTSRLVSCRFNLWQMTPVVYTVNKRCHRVQSERSVSVLWSPVLGTIVSYVILVRITITCFSKKSVLIIFVLSPLGVTSERCSQSYPSKRSVQIPCFHHPVYTSRPS